MTLSDKNITIEEFAKLIGTTTENASLMVKGQYNFTIRELAKILDVNPSTIVRKVRRMKEMEVDS